MHDKNVKERKKLIRLLQIAYDMPWLVECSEQLARAHEEVFHSLATIGQESVPSFNQEQFLDHIKKWVLETFSYIEDVKKYEENQNLEREQEVLNYFKYLEDNQLPHFYVMVECLVREIGKDLYFLHSAGFSEEERNVIFYTYKEEQEIIQNEAEVANWQG